MKQAGFARQHACSGRPSQALANPDRARQARSPVPGGCLVGPILPDAQAPPSRGRPALSPYRYLGFVSCAALAELSPPRRPAPAGGGRGSSSTAGHGPKERHGTSVASPTPAR